MFPTHVGMNRFGCHPGEIEKNVPHTRGDEPRAEAANRKIGECSPHTWG